MPDRKIYIKEISKEVTLRRNTRIKRLSLKISPYSGVVLCVPFFVSEKRAVAFLLQNRAWLEKHLANEKYTNKEIPSQINLASCILDFKETEHNKPRIEHNKKDWVIYIPEKLNFEEKQKLKRELLIKILHIEAKRYLPSRVSELADNHGFKYGKISLRNQKTRWGSCSFHDNISLNIQLMRLPSHLIDYVIIHELCHTVHKNHSSQFWELAHEIMGSSLYFCKEEMKNQRIKL